MKFLMVVIGAAFLLGACAAESVDEPTVPSGNNEAQQADEAEEPAPDRYEISNISIRKEKPLVGNVPTYHVVFDAKWLGDGGPPLTTCSYTVFAKDGSKIETGRTRLAVEDGKNLEATVQKEGVVPASAKFGKCPPNS